MTTPTHICTGYLIAQYVYSVGLISPEMLPAVTTVSILAANAPDFDVVAIRKMLNHRKSPLHVPFYWFTAFAVTGLIIKITGNRIAATYVSIIGINVLIHFLMDSISVGVGIRWLAPFRQKDFGIIFGKPSESVKSFMKNFFRYPIVYAEALFWAATYLVRLGVWHV
jgi:membrane-bound metal-dependent hydrolase YbcI (DUF457 family)